MAEAGIADKSQKGLMIKERYIKDRSEQNL